jgi:hypothetical protein
VMVGACAVIVLGTALATGLIGRRAPASTTQAQRR